jgi:hypothetical protein
MSVVQMADTRGSFLSPFVFLLFSLHSPTSASKLICVLTQIHFTLGILFYSSFFVTLSSVFPSFIIITYYLFWLCSPAPAMASCGSAAQRRLWPPVALQPSAVYGLLGLCSPAPSMASCGSAAQRRLWPPRPRGICDHTQRRATVGRTPLND